MNLQVLFSFLRVLPLIALFLAAAPARSQLSGVEHPLIAPYREAVAAVNARDWDRAWPIAARHGLLIHDIVEWHWLRAGRGTPSEVLSFLERRPDWPGLSLLRQRSEVSLDIATTDEVLRFFDDGLPKTGRGALTLSAALAARDEPQLAENVLIHAWAKLRMDEGEEAGFMVGHTRLLAPYHVARLDARLWAEDWEGAQRLLPLVSRERRAVAEARMALGQARGGGEADAEAVAATLAVPESHRGDPGLAFAEYDWLISKRDYDSATELLARQSVSAEHLGDPEAWANWRRWLARRQLREGDEGLAYWLAATHFLTEGAAFADLEFLAGYIALQRLEDPATALGHFQTLAEGVATPISRSRAHYWAGRAHEAAGDSDAAEAAYREAARYWSAFYGLLALDRLGESLPMAHFAETPPWRDAAFQDSSVWQLATLAYAAGDHATATRFYAHLVETLPEDEALALGGMAQEFNDPNLALEIAKRAASFGKTLPDAYFPMHPLARVTLPAPPEKALAIARRESEFRTGLTSPVGAEGMMQLMPATARAMSAEVGLPYSPDKVLDDWLYNALLGGAYLAEVHGEFDGNPAMIAAAYNAGPSRVRDWNRTNGDPRRGEIDIIDWIEAIPFRETRNYVMRVTEAEAIYAARLGRPIPAFHDWLQSGRSETGSDG